MGELVGIAPPRRHRGDIMSPATRSAVMARIKGTNTGPERSIFQALGSLDLEFEKHAKDLPGRPDVVFRAEKVAVFVDGDFWHGWRFPSWKDKLSAAWEEKIAATRRRDARNFRKLRHSGWAVVRIWEHQIKRNMSACVERIKLARARSEKKGLSSRGKGN